MSSGADLFVVCKQCGAEVSPYITECPYCGNRLRRRAPKLPRQRESRLATHRHRIPMPALGRLRRGEITGVRGETLPYATSALIAVSAVVWILTNGASIHLEKLLISEPLHGEWWKVLTTQFAYLGGFSASVYAFVAVFAVGIFGWLLERRHGPFAVLVLFFGAGATGALAALAVYPLAEISGANAGALGLLAAWAVPDLGALRTQHYYDGDLLGAGAIAAVLLAMPFARPEVSWLAGIAGALVGLVLGLGLSRMRVD
jgi:membrane associated rhomboid family serine protease